MNPTDSRHRTCWKHSVRFIYLFIFFFPAIYMTAYPSLRVLSLSFLARNIVRTNVQVHQGSVAATSRHPAGTKRPVRVPVCILVGSVFRSRHMPHASRHLLHGQPTSAYRVILLDYESDFFKFYNDVFLFLSSKFRVVIEWQNVTTFELNREL